MSQKPSATNGLYTYRVTPAGPLIRVRDTTGRDELRFLASLVRQDGGARTKMIVVRPTEAQPDIVEQVSEAVARKQALRMVVRFERTVLVGDVVSELRSIAVAETLLGAPRQAASVPNNQLDLFA